jgi:hypothetical protein
MHGRRPATVKPDSSDLTAHRLLEPFIRTGRNRTANLALWNAGLNQASDRRCFERSMEIMDGAFRSTRISLATRQVWQVVVGPGR